MSESIFKPAVKKEIPAKLALIGPSGSGKTYTALRLAEGFPGTTALIDTENRSSALYADEFEFDVAALRPPYHPRRYALAIAAAAEAGYGCVIVDSISHAWEGAGGVQEIVDKNTKGGNQWSGWAAGTPAHQLLVEAILQSPIPVIATMRAKTLWETVNGKPKKIGTGPVQRAGIDYEFSIVGTLDQEHALTIDKSRCNGVPELAVGAVVSEPDASLTGLIIEWLHKGAHVVDLEAEADRAEKAEQGQAEFKIPDGVGVE